MLSVTPMNPRTELEARYPSADFSVYFRTAEACRTIKGMNTHDHHLCPRKQFPEFVDSPENLITVTVEDHAFLHKLLEAACGIKAPSTLWIENQRAAALKGGRTMTPERARTARALQAPYSAARRFKHGASNRGKKQSPARTVKTANALRKDLTELLFGKWTVKELYPRELTNRVYWVCQCACGTIGRVHASNLTCGKSTCCRTCSKAYGRKTFILTSDTQSLV